MVSTGFHPPEEVQKKKKKKKIVTKKTKKVRSKKSSLKQNETESASPERPGKKKKSANLQKAKKPVASSSVKSTGEQILRSSPADEQEIQEHQELQELPAGDSKRVKEVASGAKSAKFRKKKAQSSSTDTSDEEYKAMVAAGLIKKPAKRQSQQQTVEFKPKTEEELLDYFLSRHNADQLLPKPQQKAVDTPEKPLSKRDMFKQYFETKDQGKESEVREIKASDYFPLALAAEEIKRSKQGKAKKKKRKKGTKKQKQQEPAIENATKNTTKTPNVTKKHPRRLKAKKTNIKSKKKLLEAEDPIDEAMHDVTAASELSSKGKQVKKKKKKKRQKKSKKKNKSQGLELPAHLQKLIDAVTGAELELCAGNEDHNVGTSGYVADDEGKHMQDEGQLGLVKDTAGISEDTNDTLDKTHTKTRIPAVKRKQKQRRTMRARITQRPIVNVPNKKLSHFPRAISTDDEHDKLINRIWVEVSGPSLQVEEFSADLHSRLMRAPPGANLSLMQLFSTEEMRGIQRIHSVAPPTEESTHFPAMIENMERIQDMLDIYVSPIGVFRERSFGANRRSPHPRKTSPVSFESRGGMSLSLHGGKGKKSPQKPDLRHKSNVPMNQHEQQLPHPPLSPRIDLNTKRKIKVKQKKRSSSLDTEYKDSTMEAETQMKSLETSTTDEEAHCAKGTAAKANLDQSAHRRSNGASGKHVTFQSSLDTDDHLMKVETSSQQGNRWSQQERPPSEEEFDHDSLRDLQARMKHGMRAILTEGSPDDMHEELEALWRELAERKYGETPHTLIGNPRVYDKALVRYELPMDITKLEGLTPLQYLEEYSFVNESLKSLHARVYRRHRDLQPTGKLFIRTLTAAMSEVMGHDWSSDDSDAIRNILGTSAKRAVQGSNADSVSFLLGSNTGNSDPTKTKSSSQSTVTSLDHQSPPGSTSTPNPAASRLIDLLNAGRERRLKEPKLAGQAKKGIASDSLSSKSHECEPSAPITVLDFRQFHAVAALAERLFCFKYAKQGDNVVTDKDYVEIADFERLEEKLSYTIVSKELHDLLLLIKNS